VKPRASVSSPLDSISTKRGGDGINFSDPFGTDSAGPAKQGKNLPKAAPLRPQNGPRVPPLIAGLAPALRSPNKNLAATSAKLAGAKREFAREAPSTQIEVQIQGLELVLSVPFSAARASACILGANALLRLHAVVAAVRAHVFDEFFDGLRLGTDKDETIVRFLAERPML
jgi:hypothetical protein